MKLFLFVVIAAVVTVGCSQPDSSSTSTGTSSSNLPATVTPKTSSAPAQNSTPSSSTDAIKFATVQPIFTQNCLPCHAAGNPKAGIDLSNYDGIMKGGRSGPVINPGDPEGSKLDMALHGKGAKQMPPKGPIDAADISKIEAWIKSGAKNT